MSQWFSVLVSGPVFCSCMAMCGHVWSCLVIYGHRYMSPMVMTRLPYFSHSRGYDCCYVVVVPKGKEYNQLVFLCITGVVWVWDLARQLAANQFVGPQSSKPWDENPITQHFSWQVNRMLGSTGADNPNFYSNWSWFSQLLPLQPMCSWLRSLWVGWRIGE